jgi:hypothetical protein
MTRLFLAIPIFAAGTFHAAHCQVEYQHFEGFSVLTEPSPIPEERSNASVRMEQILILRDSVPKQAPVDQRNCRFLDTNTSMTWETPDAMPVMYVYRNCGKTVEMTYRDLSGREWKQSQLRPLQRETLSKTLPQLDGSNGLEPGEDAQTQIAAYAICTGVVPKPDWFDRTCNQQTPTAPH